MLRRLTIGFVFLAYQINLVHSILPHHHHNEAQAVVSHSHDLNNKNDHHHDDHDHESRDNGFNLAHLIAEVAHNPSSSSVIHNATSEDAQKTKTVVYLPTCTASEYSVTELLEVSEQFVHRETHYSSRALATAPLRGPPVA